MHAFTNSRTRRTTVLLAPLLFLGWGCAVKPKEKVAHGEDHNLFKKVELLGRPLEEVQADARTESGKATAKADVTAELNALLARVDPASDAVAFDISESYLTVSTEVAGVRAPVLQFAIKGHFDLSAQANPDGVETQFLVKDTASHLRWQERAYVEVDPADPLLIKANDDTLKNLYSVATLRGQVTTFNSAADLPWLTPEDRADLIATFKLTAGQQLVTELTRRNFTLYRVESDKSRTVLAQGPVTYFDLSQKKDDREQLTPELVRDRDQADWSGRAFVEIDAETIHLAKPQADLMDNLYDKAALTSKSRKLGGKDTPLLSNTLNLAALLAESAISLNLADEVTLKVTEKSVDVLKNGELVMKYAVLGHFDIAPKVDEQGEVTSILERNSKDRPWQLRRYVAVDPRDPELVHVATDIADNRHEIAEKSAIAGKCFAVDAVPMLAIIPAIKKEMKAAEASGKVCLEVTQTVLSVYLDILWTRRLLLTYDISSHFDVGHDVSLDGRETSSTLTRNQAKANWQDRAYLEVNAANPQVAKNLVAPHSLSKTAFEGEFLYTATVTEAHSENGLVFEGWTLQSPDRLNLVFSEDSLTAYKLNETLNTSGAKSPVLRYNVDQFDVGRVKNGYGDLTNVTAEDREKPWSARKFARVDFSSNQIPSYFNDLLGVEKLYYGMVFSAKSTLLGEIKIEDGMIAFDTEEVVTPNARADFTGSGETQLEPVAIKIHHTLLKVGTRPYQAKPYDALDFAKFGYFDVTEAGLDPILGKTDDTLKHYMRRFDLTGGKHINYYLSPGFPEKYRSVAHEVVAAWNVAFKAAVGREDVVILNENAVIDAADPRYNMMVFVDGRNDQAPLGFGPSFFDPTTGENISGKAYIYGEAIRQVMGMASDFYDLGTGARTVEDFSVATSPRGAGSVAVATSRGVTPLRPAAIALPTSRTAALSFTRSTPSPFKVADSLRLLASTSGLLPAATSNDAAVGFASLTSELKARVPQVGGVNAEARFQGCLMDPEAHIVSAVKFIQAHPGMSKEQVMAELENRMVFTTLLHETGHNLGLRHNFQGSFDETNYPPMYHKLKSLGDDAASDPTLAGEWIYKYRGSSVMDYNDDFEALDKAAGPYDVAAIKFGYGDKLEKVVGADEFGALLTEDLPKSEFDQLTADLRAANPAASWNSIDAKASQQLAVRPYLFCTDEHVENDPTCKRFDRGSTMAEVTASMIQDYQTMYDLYGFRRGRRMFTGSSNSILSRFILPMRQLVDEYIYNIIFSTFPHQDAADGSAQPASPADYVNAINQSLDFFNGILDSVEPGEYHLDKPTGELVSGRATEADAKNVVIGLKTGKYLLPRFEIVGHEERVMNRGVELDKIGVLWAMSMRGFPAEKYMRANLSANYFDLLKKFTMARFSSVVREDAKIDLLAQKGEDGDFHPVSDPSFVVDPANPDQLKVKIKPSSSLAVQEYAMMFSAANFDTSADRTFGDYVDYRIKGIDAALPDGVTAAEFTSTSGLHTYVVPNSADGLSISYQIGLKAAEAAAKRVTAQEGMAAAGDSAALMAQAIARFGDAWALGEGVAMPESIVGILQGNFDNNLPILGLMVDQWMADATEPEAIASLTAAKDALNLVLDQYQAVAAARAVFATTVTDAEKELTKYESELIRLKNVYNLLK